MARRILYTEMHCEGKELLAGAERCSLDGEELRHPGLTFGLQTTCLDDLIDHAKLLRLMASIPWP